MEYIFIIIGIIIIAFIVKKTISCLVKSVLTLIVIALVAAAYYYLHGI